MSSVLSLIVLLCLCLYVEAFLLFHPHGCIQTSLDQQLLVSEQNRLLRREKNGVRERNYQNYIIKKYLILFPS